MVLLPAKIVRRQRNSDQKPAMGEKKFSMSFFKGNNFKKNHFLLVSNVKLWEIYDKKEISKKYFSHGKQDGKMLISYTFRIGYTHRVDCI
jgi:hypothetical protein